MIDFAGERPDTYAVEHGSTRPNRKWKRGGRLLAGSTAVGIIAASGYLYLDHKSSGQIGSPAAGNVRARSVAPQSSSASTPAISEKVAKPSPAIPRVSPETIANSDVSNRNKDLKRERGSARQPPPSLPPDQRMQTAEPPKLQIVTQVQPIYPEFAKRARMWGRVTLAVDVAPDGSVTKSHLQSGNPILARAAADAVLGWRYRPYSPVDGQASVSTIVNFDFALDQVTRFSTK
jgi:TonB family protein